jgi:cation:H+ antiporter
LPAAGVFTKAWVPGRTNPRRDALVATALFALVLLSASLVLSVVEGVVDGLAVGGSTVGVVTLGVAAALPDSRP